MYLSMPTCKQGFFSVLSDVRTEVEVVEEQAPGETDRKTEEAVEDSNM